MRGSRAALSGLLGVAQFKLVVCLLVFWGARSWAAGGAWVGRAVVLLVLPSPPGLLLGLSKALPLLLAVEETNNRGRSCGDQ